MANGKTKRRAPNTPVQRRLIDRIGRHAFQTTLGQGRAYSAALADSGLLSPSRACRGQNCISPIPARQVGQAR